MSDEGVHEIQLNGKQLVFMFMAVTIVAVVIFLCGVMVGRGVRAPKATEASEATVESPADPTAVVQAPPVATDTSASAVAAPSASSPTPAPEKLTYSDRLGASTSPPETLREPVVQNLSAPARTTAEPTPTKKLPVVEKKAPAADTKPEIKADAKSAAPKGEVPKSETAKSETRLPAADPQPSGGTGFVVQVAAVKARNEADTIAKRLASKGFPSYVTTPGPGAAHVFRVRVGKYTDRREAETVARRLEKEEQFKPWITR